MNRKQADAAFQSLRRHASAITPPTAPADAARLLGRAVLSQLQRDAIVHYIAVGPDNLALAYSMLKAGAAAFVTAGFLAGRGGPAPGQAGEPGEPTGRPRGGPAGGAAGEAAGEPPVDRGEIFAVRMIALAAALDGVDAAERATRLLESFARHVAAARELLDASGERSGEGEGRGEGEGADLLEAAGIAYMLGQLLESPPGPREGAPAGGAPGALRGAPLQK
jgi:hypothetical protein